MGTSALAYDFAPSAGIALLGAVWALVPMLWVLLRRRRQPGARVVSALTVATLFLCFDLVLFGAFTRLTDSGLGCPDWPGCYGHTSPLGAGAAIDAAQASLPSGPVTTPKAWIEMTHRYLATGVGVLILVLAVAHALAACRGAARSPAWWAAATLAWVCVQGAFGAWTVTWRLYPAIVTAHLLGALVLLALLTVQVQRARPDPVRLGPGLRAAVWALAALSAAQLALGGWVSTHYAVLACSDFPLCQGRWWPPMDFVHGFALRRGLGADADGNYLSFAALTAIHYAHRLGAYVVLTGMVGLAWRLWRDPHAALHRWAWGVAGIAAWQLATGVGNVVLGWPLAAAVAHTAGAAAWVVWLTALITRAHRPQRTSAVVRAQAASRVPAAS